MEGPEGGPQVMKLESDRSRTHTSKAVWAFTQHAVPGGSKETGERGPPVTEPRRWWRQAGGSGGAEEGRKSESKSVDGMCLEEDSLLFGSEP